MLIPSYCSGAMVMITSLSRRVNANSQLVDVFQEVWCKLIKKGEC